MLALGLGIGLSRPSTAASGPDLDIFSAATDASATPTTVVLTLLDE
jgi:hypothetical protein